MKRRIEHPVLARLKECRGMTMVELIVTFALLGIFMVAATFMLTATLRLFTRSQSTSNAITVSDLILDKISGEIAAADIPQKDTDGYYFWLERGTDATSKSKWIALCNRSGSPISIYADEGRLYLKYYQMIKTDKKEVNEINWHYDKRVYMGYQIESLLFSQPDPLTHPEVILIDLTLKHTRTGFTYSTCRYAKNYNFDPTTDYMCARSDGSNGMPTEAAEFEIKKENPPSPPTPPEPTTAEYTVYYQNIKGATLLPPTTGTAPIGAKVEVPGTPAVGDEMNIYLSAPLIPFYEFVFTASKTVIDSAGSDAADNSLILCYQPSRTDLVNFTVIYRDSNSKQELYREEYSEAIETTITLPVITLVNYKPESADITITVTAEDQGKIYYFDYEKEENSDNLTVTDSQKESHTLHSNMDWEELKRRTIGSTGGFVFPAGAWIMNDDTGYYVIFNSPFLSQNISPDTTLEDAIVSNNNKIKLTNSTRILVAADRVSGKWKTDKIPQKGDLIYLNGKYYLAGSNMEPWDTPPYGNCIFIKQ